MKIWWWSSSPAQTTKITNRYFSKQRTDTIVNNYTVEEYKQLVVDEDYQGGYIPISTLYYKDMVADIKQFMFSINMNKVYTLDIFKQPTRICFSICRVIINNTEKVSTKPVYRWAYDYTTRKYAIPVKRYNGQSIFAQVCAWLDAEMKACKAVTLPIRRIPASMQIDTKGFRENVETYDRLTASIIRTTKIVGTIVGIGSMLYAYMKHEQYCKCESCKKEDRRIVHMQANTSGDNITLKPGKVVRMEGANFTRKIKRYNEVTCAITTTMQLLCVMAAVMSCAFNLLKNHRDSY